MHTQTGSFQVVPDEAAQLSLSSMDSAHLLS